MEKKQIVFQYVDFNNQPSNRFLSPRNFREYPLKLKPMPFRDSDPMCKSDILSTIGVLFISIVISGYILYELFGITVTKASLI